MGSRYTLTNERTRTWSLKPLHISYVKFPPGIWFSPYPVCPPQRSSRLFSEWLCEQQKGLCHDLSGCAYREHGIQISQVAVISLAWWNLLLIKIRCCLCPRKAYHDKVETVWVWGLISHVRHWKLLSFSSAMRVEGRYSSVMCLDWGSADSPFISWVSNFIINRFSSGLNVFHIELGN